MELPELLTTVRKGWVLILAGAFLGVGAGVAATVLATPEYTATTKLFVSVRTGDAASASDVSQGNAAAQQKVRSYTDVVTAADVLQPVVDELGLRTTPARLARSIEATTSTNTVVMRIAATDIVPARASAVANAVGASFSKVVSELETPPGSRASQVTVKTIEAAVVPTAPSAPNRTVNLGIGALLGLLAGFAGAVLRSMADTRIHTLRDVTTTTAAPILGTIGYDASAKTRPLVVHADPRSPLAESFRTLRTNLQFVDLASTGGSFVVTSAMPSEGKTTTTANLAIALAESGSKVVVVDADLRRPRLADVLDIEGAAGLTDLLIGRAELEDVLQPWGTGGLRVLPAGLVPPNPSELLGSAAMRALLELLTDEFDVVLIDAPPVLPVTDAAILSTMTAGAVMVTAARRSRRNQLQSAVANVNRVGRVLGVVVTMVPARGAKGYGGVYGSYYGQEAQVELHVDDPRPVGRRERLLPTKSLPTLRSRIETGADR